MKQMASYIDNLQLPQVFNTLQCAVATWKKVGQIFMQAESIQPGGKRCAAITAQCFNLQWRGRHMQGRKYCNFLFWEKDLK